MKIDAHKHFLSNISEILLVRKEELTEISRHGREVKLYNNILRQHCDNKSVDNYFIFMSLYGCDCMVLC